MRRFSLFVSLVIPSSLALVACGDPDPVATTGISSGIASLGSDGTDGTSADSQDDSGLKLDVASDDETGMATAGDGSDSGCEKVDLLFVIDNSGSMADEQINLVNSFPSFIADIQTTLADANGYHVGVITSDLYVYNPSCLQEGAMVTQTGGVDSSNSVCGPYAEGHSYMTEADNLDTTFSCAAQVGTGGDGNERPMTTMVAALSGTMNGQGGCNEGFLRDDALLVVVIITDEEDDHEVDGCLQDPQPGSNGEPAGWYAGLVATKGGVEENIVVLALVGPDGPDPAPCPALDKCSGGIVGAEVANRIISFTEMFTNGFIGRVCEPSYAAFFSEAVGVIETACDNFVPIG